MRLLQRVRAAWRCVAGRERLTRRVLLLLLLLQACDVRARQRDGLQGPLMRLVHVRHVLQGGALVSGRAKTGGRGNPLRPVGHVRGLACTGGAQRVGCMGTAQAWFACASLAASKTLRLPVATVAGGTSNLEGKAQQRTAANGDG